MRERGLTLEQPSERQMILDRHALLAIMRLASAVPGMIDSDYFDEIGRSLLDIAVGKMPSSGTDTGGPVMPLPDGLEKARQTSTHEAWTWLGRELSEMPDDLGAFFEALRQRLEQSCAGAPVPFASNASFLSRLFGFNGVEERVLFSIAMMEKATIGFECLKSRRLPLKMHRAIGTIIDVTLEEVADVLRSDGRLAASGLVCLGRAMRGSLQEQLVLTSFGRTCFQRSCTTLEEMIDQIAGNIPVADCDDSPSWSDLTGEQDIARTILANALHSGAAGVNILLYGEPASGKSAFARFLLQSVSDNARSIPMSSDTGAVIKKGERLARLGALRRHTDGLGRFAVLMDDADSVLELLGGVSNSDRESDPSRTKQTKILLQENVCPTVWICRDTEKVDPSTLALFTLCVRLDRPPLAVRNRIAAQQLLPVGVEDATISTIARHRLFSPEFLHASARLAHLTGNAHATRSEAVLTHLNGHARVLKQPVAQDMGGIAQSPMRFDPAYLCIAGRFSAEQVMQAIVLHGSGTVLMNGPPGTGKTQFARQIAERLGREVLYVTASDINTKWHGESERNVASLFGSCNPDEQIIFLDEAETVLGAREGAMHRASVSVTAEFLRQLEPFRGVFLCATNHLKSIDGAMIRRFAFRLDFKPLTSLQREAMLFDLAGVPADQRQAETCRQQLARLDGLTPGDFANVKRRFYLLGHQPTLADWLLELRQEWLAKPERPAGHGIGFA